LKITDVDMPKQAFVYAAIHLLSNRLQIVGNRIDPTISEKQWFVLAAISKYTDTPPNIGDIAHSLGTSRQNIKKMTNILEQRGFIRMEKDATDLRSIRLFLTENCVEYFKDREQQENEYIKSIFHGIDDEMLGVLCEGLRKLLDNIDKMLESDSDEER